MTVSAAPPEQDQAARPEIATFASGAIAAYSARSPGKETANEDALAVEPFGSSAGVLAVADGVGGERRGADASRIAVETLVAAVREGAGAGTSLRAAILDGFERANQRVLELGGAATTLAVLEVDGDHVRPYHVGDSLILVVGQRGKIKHRTLAHGPVGYAVEAGLLDDSDALHHDDLHVVSNVLGSPDMRIEIGSRRRLAARDTALLASDGVSDNLYLEEIVAAIRVGPLDRAARRLIELATARMRRAEEGLPHKPDDLTLLLFRPAAPPRLKDKG
jgi:serine/threonine protein phosphatase PrpC